ncbi:MAG: sugar ABC transporter permease [Clostridiales bacterium]|nr:sugar ABC transporter permease [Clostridiales bacterium]
MKKIRRNMNFLYIPALAVMICFIIYPLIRGVFISLFQWNGYSQSMKFVGLKNYLSLFSDKKFVNSFLNTLLYGFGSALLQNIFGLGLALLVDCKFKTNNLLRTIVYLPVMVSSLVMGYIMYFFLQYNHGVLNEVLAWFNIEPINWLKDANRGKIFITLINSWQYVGMAMIVYLAGLQNIPTMYMEAAALDGGNWWDVFWHVTLPLLIPAMTTAVVTNVIGGLKLNDVVISLTNGGPANKTHSLSTFISYNYFEMEKAGYASAIGIFMFVFIYIVSTLLTNFFKKREVQY